jgi:hypothetical protein
VEVDGAAQPTAVQAGEARLSLVDDAQIHRVRVVLGEHPT